MIYKIHLDVSEKTNNNCLSCSFITTARIEMIRYIDEAMENLCDIIEDEKEKELDDDE